ncbi:Rz1-like lysis system protein LysC [Serratia fonticola]|uniref:Rz1-like lysis system protein LysC n=1 Tax=Serratia fonticola TaxID=47917 RepID=UPI003F64475E
MLKTERYIRLWSLATVAISACLILLSTSCGVRTTHPPTPKLVFVYPPAVYTQLCDKTSFTGSTFGDAVIALQVAQNELNVCASRIEGLIKWQQSSATGDRKPVTTHKN